MFFSLGFAALLSSLIALTSANQVCEGYNTGVAAMYNVPNTNLHSWYVYSAADCYVQDMKHIDGDGNICTSGKFDCAPDGSISAWYDTTDRSIKHNCIPNPTPDEHCGGDKNLPIPVCCDKLRL
ncbi:hypothetical protein CPB83DRAFT_863591, partial [Crepidotus variabilis]